MIKFNFYKFQQAHNYVLHTIKSQLNITFFHMLTFFYVWDSFYSSVLLSLLHSLPLIVIFLKGIEQHAEQDCDPGGKETHAVSPRTAPSLCLRAFCCHQFK